MQKDTDSYSFHEEARRERICNEKWKIVRFLFTMLEKKDRNIFLRKYCHFCFKHEFGRHIKRYTFVEILKQYDIPTEVVHRVYTIFDSFGLEQFDWREMGFMLFTVGRPNSKPREDLDFAFKFFTGNGLVDVDTPTLVRIRLRDVEEIFNFIIRPSSLSSILDMFYSSWGNASAASSDIMDAISQDNICISPQIVTRIIQDITAKVVLIDDFEEKYYPSELVRLRRSTRLMKYALNTQYRAMEIAILRWKEVIRHQKIIQAILFAALSKLHHQTLDHTFLAMRKFTVQCIAIVELQRLFRGHAARSIARLEVQKHSTAILLQSIYRGTQSKEFCRGLLIKRGQAATNIQRSFRGYLGRAVARTRRETKKELRIVTKTKRSEMKRLHAAKINAEKVQMILREDLARTHFNTEIEKRRRELVVLRELEEREATLKQHSDIHNKQVFDHCKTRTSQLIQMNAQQQLTKNQRRLLCQKQFFNGKVQIQEANNTQREVQRRALIKRRREEWEIRIDTAVVSFRRQCDASVQAPETKSERSFRNYIKKLTKEKIKKVLRRADTSKDKMELQEARIVAESEVVEMLAAARRVELEANMRKDLLELEQQIQIQSRQVDAINLERIKEQANWILCSAVRRYIARKKLQALASQAFEKLFDEHYKTFYYRNARTVSEIFNELWSFTETRYLWRICLSIRAKCCGQNQRHWVIMI